MTHTTHLVLKSIHHIIHLIPKSIHPCSLFAHRAFLVGFTPSLAHIFLSRRPRYFGCFINAGRFKFGSPAADYSLGRVLRTSTVKNLRLTSRAAT